MIRSKDKVNETTFKWSHSKGSTMLDFKTKGLPDSVKRMIANRMLEELKNARVMVV